jgi:hypothetical protein
MLRLSIFRSMRLASADQVLANEQILPAVYEALAT